MTNHQSVATVTAILSQMVQGFAARAIEGASVTMQRPDSVSTTGTEGIDTRVNLFLFQVNFDPAFRNADLPTRDRAGQLLQRPRAALQLHYLLSFYGDESVLAPQRMLAAVVAGLHSRPLISMARAATFVAENQESAASFNYLADSQLAEQGESVRLTPDSLNLEELSKLWSVFFQVPYALSIAYKAAVVLVDAQEELPRSVLPVRIPVVEVGAGHVPSAAPHPGAAASRPRVTGAAEVEVLLEGVSRRVIRVDSDVSIGPDQRVELLLDELGGARASFVLAVPRRDSAGTQVQVPRARLPAGTFLVRLRIDGVESALETSNAPADWSYSGPTVVLT